MHTEKYRLYFFSHLTNINLALAFWFGVSTFKAANIPYILSQLETVEHSENTTLTYYLKK